MADCLLNSARKNAPSATMSMTDVYESSVSGEDESRLETEVACQPHQVGYFAFVHNKETPVPEGRWTQGASLDGKGQYQSLISEPLGQEPQLAKPRSDSGAQTDQMGLGSSIATAANDLVSGGSSAAS